MSFSYLPSLRVLVFVFLLFPAIDYQRKPIIFDVLGLFQMNEVSQWTLKLLGGEGEEERGKANRLKAINHKGLFHLKYELKPRAVSCNIGFFLISLDKFFL